MSALTPASRRGRGLLERPAAVVLIAPILGVLVLRASLFNGVAYRDPWFYSGHAWALAHHIEVFNWFYYAVRFPVVLPISWFTAVFGPVAGYLVLRYVILVATGAIVYVCVRLFSTKQIAACAVLLLAMSPFYVRMVLWDYTSFVGLPATIAAVGIWFLGSDRRGRLWSAAGVGALICIAVFANPLYFLVVPCIFGVEAVAAARSGAPAVREFAVRCVAALVAAVAVFAGGYVGYRFYLGGFSPRELVQPTIDFARDNKERSTPFQVPARIWLLSEPRIWAPVIACLAIVVVMGRRLLENSIAARLAQVSIAYTAIFWLYRKFVPSSVIETWLAYSMTAVTLCFAVPLVLDAAQRRWPESRRLVWPVVLATAAVTLAVRVPGDTAVSAYDAVSQHRTILFSMLLASVVAVVAIRVARSTRVRQVAAAGFTTSMAVFALAPAYISGSTHQTAEFSPRASAELDAYDAAHSLIKLVRAEDAKTGRLRMWSSMTGVTGGVTWADLPHLGGGIQDVEHPVPLPQLTDREIELLSLPDTTRVLVLADSRAAADTAVPALMQRGLLVRSLRKGSWGDGRVNWELVLIIPPAPPTP